MRYGLDAPGVIRNLLMGACAAAVIGAFGRGWGLPRAFVATMAWTAAVLVLEASFMVWTSLVGKRIAARRLMEVAALRGGESLLDVGCGRGLLLLEGAKRLPQGQATGLDLWRSEDLSGNARAATEANVAAEGVAERVTLVDGDARHLPFADGTFDRVVSSLAIHNIDDPADRARAILEMARVLKSGGRILLQDFRHTSAYASVLRDAGLRVERRLVNPLLMFPPTWRVVAEKR